MSYAFVIVSRIFKIHGHEEPEYQNDSEWKTTNFAGKSTVQPIEQNKL